MLLAVLLWDNIPEFAQYSRVFAIFAHIRTCLFRPWCSTLIQWWRGSCADVLALLGWLASESEISSRQGHNSVQQVCDTGSKDDSILWPQRLQLLLQKAALHQGRTGLIEEEAGFMLTEGGGHKKKDGDHFSNHFSFAHKNRLRTKKTA